MFGTLGLMLEDQDQDQLHARIASKLNSCVVYMDSKGRSVHSAVQEPPYALKGKTASDIMATPVVGLEAIVPVSEVRQVLEDTTHNGFPIYSTSQARYLGRTYASVMSVFVVNVY